MIIDSHCHLESFVQKGMLAEVLERAEAAGVQKMIVVGTSQADWNLYARLSCEHAGRIYWTVGLHPCHVEADFREQITAISTYFGTEPLPVALGEIGLDYFHLPKFPDEAAEVIAWQKEAFRIQLELASQFDCPIVIHSRNAFADCVRMIDESGVDWKKVVFHCFSEGAEEMAVLNARGGRGSFTGIITYRNAQNVRDALIQQGLNFLMIETDAPYLTPEPERGKQRNEPGKVVRVLETVAELFGLPLNEVSAQVARNTQDFFGI
jgi:TatD DNase family protein